MIQEIKDKLRGLPIQIQSKLLGVFLITTVVIFIVNIYVYSNIDSMMMQIDRVYSSNANLNYLQSSLELVQADMTDYLNTKQSDYLERYYRDVAEYQRLMENLNDVIVGDELLVMEKNIRSISQKYCEVSEQAINYRRGYIVEKFKKNFIGALVIVSLTNGMNLMGVDISYQYVVKGIIFIIAVAFDVRTRKSGK